jgi:hypothetical protein
MHPSIPRHVAQLIKSAINDDDQQVTTMTWAQNMTPLCVKRMCRIFQGKYTVSLRPMRVFPDPSICVDYDMHCVCHFDSCDHCGEKELCSCSRDEQLDDMCSEKVDVMKVMLLSAVHRLADNESAAMAWAKVMGGAGTQVFNNRFNKDMNGAHGSMPSAYDLLSSNEFRSCSYGVGAAYIDVKFPFADDPALDFTFSVVGINHDT